MHKNATKCNETLSKWCKNKHGASKIIDTFDMYQAQQARITMAWTIRRHGGDARRSISPLGQETGQDEGNP
jgi:hypothetical protein